MNIIDIKPLSELPAIHFIDILKLNLQMVERVNAAYDSPASWIKPMLPADYLVIAKESYHGNYIIYGNLSDIKMTKDEFESLRPEKILQYLNCVIDKEGNIKKNRWGDEGKPDLYNKAIKETYAEFQ